MTVRVDDVFIFLSVLKTSHGVPDAGSTRRKCVCDGLQATRKRVINRDLVLVHRAQMIGSMHSTRDV